MRSEGQWPNDDLTTAYFKAMLVGGALVVDVEWGDDFAYYFRESPAGNLSGIVFLDTPASCPFEFPATVALQAGDRKARLVVPVPPEALDACTAPKSLFLIMRLSWVSHHRP